MTPAPPAAILIRIARLPDLPSLLEIETASFASDRLSRASFRRFLNSGSARLLVADAGSTQVAGYVLLLTRKGSRRARIHSLATHPDWRRQGVAVLLLGAAQSAAREWHMDEVALEVREDNSRARRLYLDHGFEEAGSKADFYSDGATAVIMKKALRPTAGGLPSARSRVPVILVDDARHLAFTPASGRVISVEDYFRLSHASKGRIVINLARSYEPLSRGYYASLLAAARGEKGFPGAFNLLDINWKRIHARSLQEVDPMLPGILNGDPFPESVLFHFGIAADTRFAEIGALLFDRFRCPILLARFDTMPKPHITDIEALPVLRLSQEERERFRRVLDSFLRNRRPVPDTVPRAATSIALLVDPEEAHPPSDEEALEAFESAALDLSARMTRITRKDLHRLGQFDALIIRTTTALDHYTYRFARKAADEGLPVMDAPDTILKCTNKIFLYELLRAHGIPTPETTFFGEKDMTRVASQAEWPSVLKVPDSCYSLGVYRVNDAVELETRSRELFRHSDLLLLQAWTPTEFDWRIGVLDGEPLFACRYFMASGHWQIADHAGQDGTVYGNTETFPLDLVPADILTAAVGAARAVGDGLLGVDLKETPRGALVIEVNDNPNLDSGVEDAVLGSELYRRILSSLIHRVGTGARIRV